MKIRVITIFILALLLSACANDKLIVKDRAVYITPPKGLIEVQDRTYLKKLNNELNDNYSLILYLTQLEGSNERMHLMIENYIKWEEAILAKDVE